MAPPIKQLQADPVVVKELQRRSRSATIAVRDRGRADIVLLRLDGLGVEVVARRLNTTPKRVSLWSRRFETSGLDGLADKPGRGRKPSIPAPKVARVITEATRPPKGKRRWSIRSMSRHAGISASSVQRIWSRNDLKPHRLRVLCGRPGGWQPLFSSSTQFTAPELSHELRPQVVERSGRLQADVIRAPGRR